MTVLSLGLVGFGPALAAVVDQSQLSFNNGVPLSPPNLPTGQSFRAGTHGLLTEVTVFSNGSRSGPNDVTVEIREGASTSGVLLGTVTQSGIGNTSGQGGYPIRIDVSMLGVRVFPGRALTFVLTRVAGPGDMLPRGLLSSTSNPYNGGSILGLAGYGPQPQWDLMFTTSVEPWTADADVLQSSANTGAALEIPGAGSAITQNSPIGQSFKPTKSGFLTSVILFANGNPIGGTNTGVIEIRSGDGVGGPLLGTTTNTFVPTTVPGAVGIPLLLDVGSLGIALKQGEPYTFLVTKVSGPGDLARRGFLLSTANPYAAGRSWGQPAYNNPPLWDLAFQTRLVEDRALPPKSMVWTAVEIGWQSAANQSYQVQWADNPASATWVNLGTPVAGNGSTNSVFDPTRFGSARFYRVIPAP